MQLIPETARRIAAELARSDANTHVAVVSDLGHAGIAVHGADMHSRGSDAGAATSATATTSPPNLFEPRVNIALGAAYLRRLLRVFDGNLVLAVAAYNAGPKAVASWLTHGRALPLEGFSARIPYSETRGYVERVFANLSMYRYLHGDPMEPLSLPVELPEQSKLAEELY
jgi:soluble lytic murein transglycosylase